MNAELATKTIRTEIAMSWVSLTTEEQAGPETKKGLQVSLRKLGICSQLLPGAG